MPRYYGQMRAGSRCRPLVGGSVPVLLALALSACASAPSETKARAPTEVTETDPCRIILRPKRIYVHDGYVAIPEATGQGGKRIAGDPQIKLPDVVKRAMAASDMTSLLLAVELCRDENGAVRDVSVLDPTVPKDIEAYYQERMSTWKYSPFVIAGRPTPVCSVVVFIYRLVGNPGGPAHIGPSPG